MDVEMEASPSHFDPEDLSIRQQFRRYRKRHSTSSTSTPQENSASKSIEAGLLYDGQSIHSPTNAALLLENIKQEAESPDTSYPEFSPTKTQYSSRRSFSADADAGFDSIRHSLKACKQEGDSLGDGAETIFTLFASLLDSSLQGLMSFPDLILKFERACRNVSESIRYGLNIRHRVVEDKLMRQKAQLLLDEAATWSLLWYLYGKGNISLTLHLYSLKKELCLYPGSVRM